MIYADVIVNITAHALDRPFQYRIPEALRDRLEVGSVVTVPFGNGNRPVTGYVIGLSDQPALEPERIKELSEAVLDASDEEKRLTGLAVWIRDRYGSTMLQALHTVLPVKRKVRAQEKKVLVLKLPEDAARQELELMRRKHLEARVRVLEALIEEQSLPWEIVTEKLHVTPAVLNAMAKKGCIRIERTRVYRKPPLPEALAHGAVSLNEQQQAIVDSICGRWEEDPCGRYLIQGVTGSGKTEVYMELIAHAVSRSEQAIVLIPEIALTYQTLMRFYHRFGDRVSVIHSRMSEGERFDQFERAKNGDIDVMIGPRSALFTPFPHLGIIVIDEEHEESYRSGQSPRYHAREVAFQRGRMENAKVVLGSATPSLEASWAGRRGELTIFKLNQRARAVSLPEVSIADLRTEPRDSTTSLLSRPLRERMEDCLGKGDQMMLFLNRRGYAGFVTCRACGHVIKCPHCDVSLTLHASGRLACHYCGYETPMPDRCPECGSIYLRTFRAGTEQVEEEVTRLFPQARVLRMDRDTTTAKDAQLKILSAFASHEADILIGTQMIVKGHDFPDVTLVGILLADLSLNIPDYRAAERTFQLLTQAAGRAGRSSKSGCVLIQTYAPDHYAVQCAARQDYEEFYREEMAFRSMALYPPAGSLVAIHCSCADRQHLETAAQYLRLFLEKILRRTGAAILGPTDENVAKINDIWRMVLYLRSGSEELLREARRRLERYIEANEGFSSVEIQFDINQ